MAKTTKKITLDGLSNKVDKLASAMQAGFKSINTRIGSMDTRIGSIDAKMNAGFKRLDSKINGMDAKMDSGFKRLDAKMESGFNRAEENREALARMISGGFDEVLGKIDKLDQGQENIQLRLDNTAPKFELREHEKRIKRLEDRAGIRHTIQH
jgi:hypothetical protein